MEERDSLLYGLFYANFYIKMTGCVMRDNSDMLNDKILVKCYEKEENMYCSNCGNEINEGNTFCFRCGEKVVSTDGVNEESISKKNLKRRNKRNCIIVAMILVVVCFGGIITCKEKILLHFAEQYMQENRYDDVEGLLKYFITDKTNLTDEQKKLHGLYYYASICGDIEEAVNETGSNNSDFLQRYEDNKDKLEQYENYLPQQYRDIWFDLNTVYYFFVYENFQREYFGVLEDEIIGEILDQLYEITQNEKLYSIAELKLMLIEKENLLSEIKTKQAEKEKSIKKYYENYSGKCLFQEFVENSEYSISRLETQINSDEKYFKEQFPDYSEEMQYFLPSDTENSMLMKLSLELEHDLNELDKTMYSISFGIDD